MKTLNILLIAAATALPLPVHAEKLDLANMKSRQFVETSKENAPVITAWLVGYYTEETEAEVIDLYG